MAAMLAPTSTMINTTATFLTATSASRRLAMLLLQPTSTMARGDGSLSEVFSSARTGRMSYRLDSMPLSDIRSRRRAAVLSPLRYVRPCSSTSDRSRFTANPTMPPRSSTMAIYTMSTANVSSSMR